MVHEPLTPAAKARAARQGRGHLPSASLACDPSVAHLRNWIAVANPFQLTAPPAWWLQLIYDYDDQLVVFPSRKERVYRLARRARLSGGLPGDFPIHHPDTAVMKQHRLVSVAALPVSLVSSAAIIPQLRDRDIERFGGWEKYAEAVEAAEAQKEARQDADVADMGAVRHREARRTYLRRVGATVLMARGQTHSARVPAPNYLAGPTPTPTSSPAAVAGPATASTPAPAAG